eukprot:scaffold26393_cov171-Cylindrotheca_fusiformis.AAC.1
MVGGGGIAQGGDAKTGRQDRGGVFSIRLIKKLELLATSFRVSRGNQVAVAGAVGLLALEPPMVLARVAFSW